MKLIGIELDTDNDMFLLGEIKKTKATKDIEQYQVEIIEYLVEYSETSNELNSEDEQDFTVHIKNLDGQEITTLLNSEGQSKIIEKVKENKEKFSTKQLNLEGTFCNYYKWDILSIL